MFNDIIHFLNYFSKFILVFSPKVVFVSKRWYANNPNAYFLSYLLPMEIHT